MAKSRIDEKKWWESKTVLFNIVMTVLDILIFIEQSPLLDARLLPYFGLIQGVGNIILRVWLTNKPVEKVVV